MSHKRRETAWRCLKTLAVVTSPWVSVYAEQWQDDRENLLDYWRVERADSVIVLPVHRRELLLPPPMFRPGIGRCTWDFPGGRLPADAQPHEMVPRLLERELGVPAEHLRGAKPINTTPWPVDSAFSSQRLWGLTVGIADRFEPDPTAVGKRVPATRAGVAELLEQLDCLQCRALLLQWMMDLGEEGEEPRGSGLAAE